MSYLSTLIPDCPNLQESLFNVFDSCNGTQGLFRERLPFLNFLTSAANSGNLSRRILKENGKVATIELIYKQRIPVTAVVEGVDNPSCTATNKKGFCQVNCTIDEDDWFGTDCLIDPKDMTRSCIDINTFIQESILELIDVMDRKASEKAAALAVALIGNWSADSFNQDGTPVAGNTLTVSTIVGGNVEQLSSLPYVTITCAADATRFCGQTTIFGGMPLYSYFKRSSAAGCCSQFGQDLGAAWSNFGIATLIDNDIVAAFGGDPNCALVVEPGAIQLVNYTRNDWRNGVDSRYQSGSFWQGTVFSPVTGLKYDLSIKEECEGGIAMNIAGSLALKAMPLDVHAPGDNLEGVNHVAKILVSN